MAVWASGGPPGRNGSVGRLAGVRQRLAFTVLFGLLLLLAPPVPSAWAAHTIVEAQVDGHDPDRSTSLGRPPEAEPAEDQLREPGEGSTPTSLASELGSSGTIDPLSGLGIRNPVCDDPAQIRSADTRSACQITGTPETTYPTSDYGFDVFIPTGVTHPIGDFTAGFVTILNGIWLGLLFVLKLTLTLLGLAFGLNPFADGATMARLSAAVSRIYATVTEPWLSALVVCAGIALAWRGLISRDVAGSVAGTIAAVAMLCLGLWVVHSPRETVGRLASFSNQAALGIIAAPQSGNLGDPTGSYAEAMSHVWSRLVEVPFAGLDFSDVNWALGPPPEQATKKANEAFCEDNSSLTALADLQHIGIHTEDQCAAFAERRFGRPRRVIDLYLRSSPGSAARAALWNYFDKEEGDRYKPKVAAQGGDGVITRLSMLALFAIGLLGALLLLAWLGIRLLTQAAIAFVLLLALPFALFFPLLGDWGRRSFRRFGLALIGAVLAKVIYAAFLSVVLLGIVVLGSVDGAGGSATGFLLSAAFSWAVFLKRHDLIGWISVGEHERLAGFGGAVGIAGFALGRRAARSPARAVTQGATAASRRSREHSRLVTEATRRTARDSLADSAQTLADVRLREARETVAAHEGSRVVDGEDRDTRSRRPTTTNSTEEPGPTPGDSTRAVAGGRREDRRGRSAAPAPEPVRAAQELIARVERNERRGGEPWTRRDLQTFARQDRELLRGSSDPADHAHRIGLERRRVEELRGPERERAEERIEKARRRDARRLDASTEEGGHPARERPRLALERVRQLGEGASPKRREHLRALRRERRSRDRLAPRRNLSRGA